MAERQIPSTSMSHLSIGEVLALLLEEFPDVTISKIRFLESQGLIDPERTPSGYRKFYDDDVELLRCILREQRENYLPLRVIKDRLDSGEIDPTSEIPRPRGIKNMPDAAAANAQVVTMATGAHALFARTAESVDAAPALIGEAAPVAPPTEAVESPNGELDTPELDRAPVSTKPPPSTMLAAPNLLPGVTLTKNELCSMADLDAAELDNLESYGLITPLRGSSGIYGKGALDIARASKQLLDAGADVRHLRGWKVAADREVGLFEQMIQPLLRQRNPHATGQARQHLVDLDQLGGRLRDALMQAAMRHHFED
ncbi:MAG: MerR family DNA-binding transcriptional regulator [Actinomycetota bacterium]|nr:MerR family DNA-binding transcriptional regulator [Actinomycetota bacterium]